MRQETIKSGGCPMNSQQSKVPDAARSYLRSVVMAVDFEMSHLEQGGTGESHVTTDQLKENWKELVTLLALGPEPGYRECPSCHNIGMRLATRCRFCWIKLPPFYSPPEALDKASG
jgi:hypothetical protein